MEADGSIHPTSEGTTSEIAGAMCGDCGTVKPDLVRGPGRVNIDSDGVSLRCRVCVRSGNVPSIPANKTAFIRSFNDYELENGNPQYTPEYGGGEPGHFSAFQGEPIGKADEVAPNIDTFIRNPATRQKP
jgi:hypothetical protein